MIYSSHRLSRFFFWALPVVCTIALVYAPVFQFGFVWDDDWLLWRDATMHPRDVLAASWTFLPLSDNYFRPLVMLSFAVDRLLFNNLPGPMHLHNLLFHCLNAVMVGSLVSLALDRMRCNYAWFVPSLAALLFGLHPMLVESVAWISCRFDVYVTFFILLFLNMDLIIKPIKFRVLLAFLFYILACLSKEMAAGFPLIYLLFHMMLGAQGSLHSRIHALRESGCLSVFLSMAIAGVVYLFLRYSALGYLHKEVDSVITEARFGTLLQHAMLVGKTAGAFILFSIAGGAFVTPMHYQSFPISYFDVAAWFCLLSVLFLGILSGILILRGNRVGYILPIYFLACLPVLNIVFWPNADDLIQERFLNLPLAFLISVGLIIFAAKFPANESGGSRGGRFVIFGLSGLLLVNAVITSATLPIWKNHISLWSWAVSRAPNSVYANVNMAISYMLVGENAKAKKYASISNALRPDGANGNSVLAAIALDEKEYAKAIELLDERLMKNGYMLEKQVMEVLYIKALALRGLHREDEAAALLETILRQNQADFDSAFALGNLYSDKGEVKMANACWAMALSHMTEDSARKRFSDGELHVDQIRKSAEGARCIE